MSNLDPYDAILDARSEDRYADDPSAEPDLTEIKERGYFKCRVDESAGESDKFVGGKR